MNQWSAIYFIFASQIARENVNLSVCTSHMLFLCWIGFEMLITAYRLYRYKKIQR